MVVVLHIPLQSPLHTIYALHCRHAVGQNKRKFAHIVCIKMAVNSPRRKILLFLSTNMAAMTSHANTAEDARCKNNCTSFNSGH